MLQVDPANSCWVSDGRRWSTDAGRTWRTPAGIVNYDSLAIWSGDGHLHLYATRSLPSGQSLMESSDGRKWQVLVSGACDFRLTGDVIDCGRADGYVQRVRLRSGEQDTYEVAPGTTLGVPYEWLDNRRQFVVVAGSSMGPDRGFSHDVYVKRDGGRFAKTLPGVLASSMLQITGTPDVLVAGDGIWRSRDDGASWERISKPFDVPVDAERPTCCWVVRDLDLTTVRGHRVIYAATDVGPLRSQDDGATWAWLPGFPKITHSRTVVGDLGYDLSYEFHQPGLERLDPATGRLLPWATPTTSDAPLGGEDVLQSPEWQKRLLLAAGAIVAVLGLAGLLRRMRRRRSPRVALAT